MTFEYLPNDLVAVDDIAGLSIERNPTFYDETTVRLDLKDHVSGRTWTFPIRSVQETVTYDTPSGPRSSRLPTSYGLPRARIDEIVRDLIVARRLAARPMEASEAIALIEQGAFVYLTKGGNLLQFVPHLELVWDKP